MALVPPQANDRHGSSLASLIVIASPIVTLRERGLRLKADALNDDNTR